MRNDEVTLHDILEAIQALSSNTDEKFGLMDRRFESIDKRFESIDKRFETIDQRFEAIDQRFEKMDRRFEEIDGRFEEIDKRFDRMNDEIFLIRSEMATKSDIASVRRDMTRMNDALITEIDRFVVLHKSTDSEIAASRSRFGRVESFMTRVAKRLEMEIDIT